MTAGKDRAIIFISPKITVASYDVPLNSRVNASEQMEALNLSLSPNPAINGATNLAYTLKTAGTVQIELMDVLGRSVRMLQNGFAPAGNNSISIDPTPLGAGTYFVRVEADGRSAMQKLVITK